MPNHTSDRHPWFVDARSSRDSRSSRLVRVGRSEARRLAPEQLGEQLPPRPARVDVRRDHRPVLPEPLPGVAARPQLVERRGARRVRPHPALLVRPRRRRLPHRRVPHDRQGQAAARQPAGDRRRPLVRADAGSAADLQRGPARGARRAAALARDRRLVRPAAHPRRRDVRARARDVRVVLRARRRAEPRVQLHAPALRVRRPRNCATRSRQPSDCCPTTAGRCGRAATTTPTASRRGGPAATRARRAPRCSCCSRCAGRRSSTTATRSAWPTPTCPRTGCSTRSARSTAGASAAIRSGHRCRGPASRRRLHGARRRAVAPVRRHRRVQRRRPAARPDVDARARRATSSRCATRFPISRAATTAPTRARTTGAGCSAAVSGRSWRSTCRTKERRSRRCTVSCASATDRSRDGMRVDGDLVARAVGVGDRVARSGSRCRADASTAATGSTTSAPSA